MPPTEEPPNDDVVSREAGAVPVDVSVAEEPALRSLENGPRRGPSTRAAE
jgi:hypothetical protein